MNARSNPVQQLLPIAERLGYRPPPGKTWGNVCSPEGLRKIAKRMRADKMTTIAQAFEAFAQGLSVFGAAMALPPGDDRLPGLREAQQLYDKAVTLGKSAERAP